MTGFRVKTGLLTFEDKLKTLRGLLQAPFCDEADKRLIREKIGVYEKIIGEQKEREAKPRSGGEVGTRWSAKSP